MKRFRIQLVWAAIVLICGVSLMAAVYLLFNKPEVYINPGIVVRVTAIVLRIMRVPLLRRCRQAEVFICIVAPRCTR